MKKAQASIEYSTMVALAVIVVLVVILLISSKASEVSEGTKELPYQSNAQTLINHLKARGQWESLKTQTISCSNGQCEFNGETKAIDDSTFTYSDTLENAYNKCIYENDLDSCKAIVYVLGD
ncbi:hypothetical protein [Thermococcus alcaliphilus]|uniref:hypothetical protein n=1 Tax=Thermococcus alcaliphilus TaxID=139207 RepID=UPI0020907AE5|nr:hypothetical protein [Thermococcus alcaliphilus]MCO6042163.1 hypothetical protein [Thermococcus alcaliphilus]